MKADSPAIRIAKLKKEEVQDIGYYARKQELEEILLVGAANKVAVGSGPKPVPVADVQVTNYYTGSLKSITYRPPSPQTVGAYCPVRNAAARWQRSDRPSEANLFCRHCQLQFREKP